MCASGNWQIFSSHLAVRRQADLPSVPILQLAWKQWCHIHLLGLSYLHRSLFCGALVVMLLYDMSGSLAEVLLWLQATFSVFDITCKLPFFVSDSGSYHHVLIDRSGHWSPWPAWGSTEVYRTADHHTHRGPHWPLWFPGSRRESREALGHCHAVSVLRELQGGVISNAVWGSLVGYLGQCTNLSKRQSVKMSVQTFSFFSN